MQARKKVYPKYICRAVLLLTPLLMLSSGPVLAEDDGTSTQIYGVIDAYWEKVAETPAGVDAAGDTEWEGNPWEFDVPNVNLMVQGTIENRFSYFLTLAFPSADGIDVRSAWGQISLFGDLLNLRMGKLYRKFGLYNEVLDAVPTYMGIEPPELFDKDHLLLTRSTNLMLEGSAEFGSVMVSYAAMAGNDEREAEQFPFGLDFNLTWNDMVKIGTSFYTTGGRASASKSVGDGSPSGGVATWMEYDKYAIYGGYLQVNWAGFQLQTEFWKSDHEGKRDPDQVLLLLDAGLNQRQLERFGLQGGSPVAADVNTEADYSITTFYVRTGYAFEFSFGELTPYAQYDFYRNPETIASKTYGGDNEAGLSDDGEFHKTTLGLVYRPIPVVALKLDGSTHTQKYNGSTVTYPEIRFSLSYLWSL